MMDPTELNAYADGQLTPEEETRVKALLDSNPEAKAELESIRSIKKALATRLEPVECRAEWQRCSGRIKELNQTSKTESFVSRYAWAMAGALFVFIFIGGLMNRSMSGDMQTADLGRVVASLSPAGQPRSQEPREVQQFLDGLVGKASQSIKAETVDVVAGEAGEVDGCKVAKLHLRDNNGDLALIIVGSKLSLDNFASTQDPRFKAGKIQGINSIAWSDGQNTLVLAGQRSYDDLLNIALTKVLR